MRDNVSIQMGRGNGGYSGAACLCHGGVLEGEGGCKKVSGRVYEGKG